MKNKISKYQSYQLMNMSDRQWPSRRIEKAPIWCSVDLRDGNQALQDPMDIHEKTLMFKTLVDMGFKEIEVGFPAASEVEFQFMRKLIDDNLIPKDVTVQVLTQARESLIIKTFDAIKGANKAIVHLYNSTSTLQRDVVFNLDRAGILKIAVDGVRLVKSIAEKEKETNIIFQYSPESFTGTEMEFAMEVSNAVMDVWQPTAENKAILNLPATVEMSTPNIYADQIEWFDRNLKNRESILISLHNHNDRGTAVAASELALMAGADRVEGTLFGNGERTGNVDIVTLGLNMFCQGVDPELNFDNINHLIDVYEKCSKMFVHPRHPYAGELVYTAFSGSHQDAINKGMIRYKDGSGGKWGIPYLPIDPQDVGRSYEAIVRINSQSGKGGAAYIMDNEFGFTLPKKMHPEFGSLVQQISDKSGVEVKTEQIWECFEKNYLKIDQPYQLTRFSLQTAPANGDDSVESKIQTIVTYKGKIFEINGEGNGPIDAFCNGMRETFNLDFKLTGYFEHALEISSSAQAAAYIQIQNSDNLSCFGVGIDTNISVASLRALIGALNRMVPVDS